MFLIPVLMYCQVILFHLKKLKAFVYRYIIYTYLSLHGSCDVLLSEKCKKYTIL